MEPDRHWGLSDLLVDKGSIGPIRWELLGKQVEYKELLFVSTWSETNSRFVVYGICVGRDGMDLSVPRVVCWSSCVRCLFV